MIGALDSGVGGLSVLREIHRLLPDIPTLYYADQAHLPYGEKSPEQVRGYVDAVVRFLIGQGVQVIVIPCHTASAVSLHWLRETYTDIPFVGMEPAVKPAVERTLTGVVGVLTTRVTANSALYRHVLERFARDVEVVTRPAPDLVQIVEAHTARTEAGRAAMRAHLDAFAAARVDQIVLACTHFPFLLDALQPLTDAAIIDPGSAVARQVGRVLSTLAPLSAGGRNRYFTSGDPQQFASMLRHLIGVEAEVERG